MTFGPPGDRLGDLLARWEEMREQGQAVSVEELCRDCPELAGELSRRIQALLAMDRLLDPAARGAIDGADEPGCNGRSSARCEVRYDGLRRHAEGGLGEVFTAEGSDLKRTVALKFIRASRASDPESRRRFLFEAEVTGQLEHPGVVSVYGLGTDDRGLPCYAMRLIRGETLQNALNAFHDADRPGRDPAERSRALRGLLLRFISVCNTVAYAHSRGVLHRDLKPQNVMLGAFGETLVVDWGLAKPFAGAGAEAADDLPLVAETEGAPFTAGPVGTPGYMSPEQARHEPVGPASDTYSLGAMLYALLTARPPITGGTLEVLERTRRNEFPPARAVKPAVHPALEAVCARAMATRPEDRYADPLALAADIDRWLADAAVSVWREPLWDRARRWTRRHRTAVTAAAAALLAGLIGLAAVAVVQAQHNVALSKANNDTKRALAATREAKKATDKALQQSEESRKQAEAVGTFLVEAFRSPDPSRTGRDVKVADVLDRASERLDEEFAGSPVTRGALLHALGQTYYGLGLFDKAEAMHTKARAVRAAALGPDHRDTLESCNELAVVYWASGRVSQAIELFQEMLRLQTATQGPDHPDTLSTRNNLASAYFEAGRIAEALALHEATLRRFESTQGPDHPDTLTSRNNLANAYYASGRVSEAIALNEETLRLRTAKLGPDHPDTLQSRHNLAETYNAAGRVSEAIALNEETLRLRTAKLGPDHPDTLTSRNNLAGAYWAAGRTAEAVPLIETTVAQREAKLGPNHPATLTSRYNLAVAYGALGRWAEADRLQRETLARRRRIDRAESPSLADDLGLFGAILLRQSKWAEAVPPLRECLAIRAQATPDDWSRFDTMSQLGGALLDQGRQAEAEPLVVRGYEGLKARETKVPAMARVQLSEAAMRVVRLYESWGKPEAAAAWKARLGLADLPTDVFARP